MKISPLEFPAVLNNSKICHFENLKRLKFENEKDKLLKINTSDQQYSSQVNGQEMEVNDSFRCLGDIFSSKDDSLAMIEERVNRSVGLTVKLVRRYKFGNCQINNMLLLYQAIFLLEGGQLPMETKYTCMRPGIQVYPPPG